MGTNALLFQNPMKAVTFVSSLDSETDGWATIVNNKTLSLALMLGMMGLPIVYIKDWLPKSVNGYALDEEINNLVWCSRNLANGGVDIVYSDARTYVFQRTGPPGALIALNNDIWNPRWTTVTCRTRHSPGTVMHDYTGKNSEDSTVDSNGNLTFGIPPAANGKGYGFWAPAGLGGPIAFPKLSCTQSFFGADDLDIGPATNGTITVGRVWIDAHSPIESELAIDTSGWAPGTGSVAFQIHDPLGNARGHGTVTVGDATARASSSTEVRGWHSITLTSSGLPLRGAPFTFKIEYTASQTIARGEP
jgi:alpha-amylase